MSPEQDALAEFKKSVDFFLGDKPDSSLTLVNDFGLPHHSLNDLLNAFVHIASAVDDGSGKLKNAVQELNKAARHIQRAHLDFYKVHLLRPNKCLGRSVGFLEELWRVRITEYNHIGSDHRKTIERLRSLLIKYSQQFDVEKGAPTFPFPKNPPLGIFPPPSKETLKKFSEWARLESVGSALLQERNFPMVRDVLARCISNSLEEVRYGHNYSFIDIYIASAKSRILKAFCDERNCPDFFKPPSEKEKLTMHDTEFLALGDLLSSIAQAEKEKDAEKTYDLMAKLPEKVAKLWEFLLRKVRFDL
ncbi:MAG: hypothetical protein LBU39_08655 [Desulfobulbaceae bacterium]|jgi:hypothetical protein|nr:hypothetical protein [Desulfobulbaceae bacterium]